MLEWREYLNSVTETKTAMDNLALTSKGRTMHISPIVKASILMLEDMISAQGVHNIFVFPEVEQFAKEFLLGKVIYNITSGKIQMSYDPNKFRKGQILKYKNCAVEFVETKDYQGRTLIFVKFSDGMIYGLPIDIAPYFQISDSRMLSTYKRFKEKYSVQEAIEAKNNPEQGKNLLDILENHRTHLGGTVFYVSAITTTKNFLTTAEFNGKRITDILYMAQVNGDGEVANLAAGQLSGNPAIILASDLYAVQNAIDKGIHPQSVIFDASQANSIEKQLDAFDDLGRRGYPIACITDTANSFELSPLTERDYNLWRWDRDSITDEIIPSELSDANTRVVNCANHTVEYLSVDDSCISRTVGLLYKQKGEIEDQPPQIIAAYEKLFSLAFSLLRCVVPLETSDKENYRQIILNCISDIEREQRFIGAELYSDLVQAANSLLPVFERDYTNHKYDAISNIVLSGKYKSLCIVIPEKLDRYKYQKYWETLDLPFSIRVMYPMEFREDSENNFDIAVLAGWLGNRVMRQIIYGFTARSFFVLTYPCEDRWKKAHTRVWKQALNNSGNGEVIRKAINTGTRRVSDEKFDHPDSANVVIPVSDEFDDIENVIRSNKFKQYTTGERTSEIVEAYPISFVGGYLAFFRSGHKALVATDIIANGGDKIYSKLPEKLEVGDFVIIRESEHDIIRDLADLILERSGKSGLRSLALKWKESLSVEALFSTQDEIYRKLCLNGCKKDLLTFRNWMTNDDLIQPNDKEDLLCIALATGDDVLKEKVDAIYEAGKEVRGTHVQAGRILSQRLKNRIGEYIRSLGAIDTFNVWDPITLQIDDVGQVRIFKVIDVNSAVPVDSGNTNRLLAE